MSETAVSYAQKDATSLHAFEFGEQFTPRVAEIVTAPNSPDTSKQLPVRLAPMSAAQLVRDLKQRLRYVENEIKTRKTLEKERDQIRRLIKAAKQDTATVHVF